MLSNAAILLLIVLGYCYVSAAGVDPRCKVTNMRTGSATKVACKMIDEYEEYGKPPLNYNIT